MSDPAPTPVAPISIADAPHYTWGDGCDGWHLVRTPALSVIQERMPPHTSETPHRHAHARQFFYVLSGSLTIRLPGVTHHLTAGSGLEVPPGVAHVAINDSDAAVEFLVTSAPPSHGDRDVVADIDA